MVQPQFDHQKYRAFPALKLNDRTWPSQTLLSAPQWCSVDLRDGNQALIEPMSVEQKKKLFQLLVDVGFKQIEIGFPSASATEFEFCRWLIEENKIPNDVTVQVLTQARPALIQRTFEALDGVKSAIVHVYNSTSKVQRDKVFKLDRQGIIDIAVKGAQDVIDCSKDYPQTQWQFQYSPESFTATELDFAVDICNAVLHVWQPTNKQKAILNLPATVEMSTPNVYADQIEWFIRHIDYRDAVIISQHTHNDRGCAVAAAELGSLAGAQRVEGTLFGNGERTGNMDIITYAMNLYSQGIDPQLDLSDIDTISRVAKECTQLPIHPRHPYAGELVYTAFSGSHQDAIKKCLALQSKEEAWDVAYLPIDPADLGRDYQEVIRINSQSGKGGIAYILERDYGIELPRWALIEFSSIVQAHSEQSGEETSSSAIWNLFERQYLKQNQFSIAETQLSSDGQEQIKVRLSHANNDTVSIAGQGSGALEAFNRALSSHFKHDIEVLDYSEHALSQGVDSKAICYIQARIEGHRYLGVAIHQDIMNASLQALLCTFNQHYQTNHQASLV
ncbi:2-isopropylmalate synthase [Alginatibacterium sediminis]|uniref:2-isopropylmalate synthase n=1 Tax=Alginatibacterium sediminis TaxID=2164068 RepID=A0A420E729_9ALTE|nr:2-isopropylmalate synthase [Alginatibacterium sediminis]RKF14450.1 2-isopropylmalate synthase [Alginatibacterium sediminis]